MMKTRDLQWMPKTKLQIAPETTVQEVREKKGKEVGRRHLI
jgi:hypothetical protein